MKHKIAVIDDHSLIANLLTDLINGLDDFIVLYTCGNGIDFQTKLNETTRVPDIVLLDISMPKMDGYATALWLKNKYPEVKILVLSMQNDENSLIKMIGIGVDGYMLKNSKTEELEKGLKILIENGEFFPEWANNKLVLSYRKNSRYNKPSVQLSSREKEFLKYVATELKYKEIADIMCCSHRTVENYRDSLFEKLEIKSRVMLAVYAVKNGYST